MTITEAILSFPGLSDIPDNYITKVLVDRSVTGSVDYTLELKPTVDLCAADCYVAQVNNPDFSEGRFSQKMSRGNMLAMADRLYRDNGETEKADDLMIGRGNAKKGWW